MNQFPDMSLWECKVQIMLFRLIFKLESWSFFSVVGLGMKKMMKNLFLTFDTGDIATAA